MRDFQVKEKDIRVIHNGIDVKKYQISISKSQMEIKRNLGLGEGPVIGIVARLSAEKGHSYLIKAMPEVITRVPKAQLLIVGEGRMKEELSWLTQTLGLEKSVFFLPQVFDTQEVLSAMDLFVLPSLKEGLGLSLMEAMACGIAVIGASVGGIRSLIQDQENGLLVKPADSSGLAGAILELFQNTDKAKFLGRNARAFIAQNFSQEKMVQETERVYLECLSTKD
jgi:glycosyltransferase involved in cell wall biosynthesis